VEAVVGVHRAGGSNAQYRRAVAAWIEAAIHDLGYAVRTFRRKPGFISTAVLSLALGIGSNASLIALIDSLLLRRLPVSDPAQLVHVRIQRSSGPYTKLSFPLFERIRAQGHSFSGALAVATQDVEIEEAGQTVPVRMQKVSGEFFDVLGAHASRGQLFRMEEVKGANGALAVISEAYWQAHYGANPAVLGTHFWYAGKNFTIVGMAGPGFRGIDLDSPCDLWVPFEQTLPPGDIAWTPNMYWLEVIARLKPDVTLQQARVESNALIRQQREEQASTRHFENEQERARFFDMRADFEPGGNGISGLRERFSRPLMVLESLAGLVLLIACANLANLMLARATARNKELAVRQALGASRGRLVRQLLTESLLIASVGALMALPVAFWINGALLRLLPTDAQPALKGLMFHMDMHMLGITSILAMLTCLLFGLGPALRATRPRLTFVDKDPTAWLGSGLVVSEVALCMLLLIVSGLFVRTLRNLRYLDAGFVPDQALLTTVRVPKAYSGRQVSQFHAVLLKRLAALPEVRAVGFSNFAFLSGNSIGRRVAAEGHTPKPDEPLDAIELSVSPGFFAAVGTPLLLGRDFTDRDDTTSANIAIVGESFARQFFDGESPLGRHFGFLGASSSHGITVIGVVKDVKYITLRGKPTRMVYTPLEQRPVNTVTLAVRVADKLWPAASAIRQTAKALDAHVSLGEIAPFTEVVDRTLIPERMLADLATASGILALILACIGLHGVLAYRVSRRSREIGLRIAIGASRGAVHWMVLRESLVLLGIGAAIGISLALAATHLLKAMLYGLGPNDLSTMSYALAILALVSMAATYAPARRAARVDPMVALRCE
jgi:predicted permease